MTDEPAQQANRPADARQSRLRDALRENLRRRKSQSRGRANADATTQNTSISSDSGRTKSDQVE